MSIRRALAVGGGTLLAACGPDNGIPTVEFVGTGENMEMAGCTDPAEGATLTCTSDEGAEPSILTRDVEHPVTEDVRNVVRLTVEDGNDNLIEVVASQLPEDSLLAEGNRNFVAVSAVDASSAGQQLDVRAYVTQDNGDGWGPSAEVTAEASFPDSEGWLAAAGMDSAFVFDVTDNPSAPLIFRVGVGTSAAPGDNPPTQIGEAAGDDDDSAGDDDDSADPSR